MRIAVIGACLLGLAGCSRELPPPTACPDLTQGCRVNDSSIAVRTDHTPSALHPFMLMVEVQGARQVHAEFVMQGMEMGLNRYRLEQTAAGVWRGRVTLPVCVSGRRDWLLILDVDGERRVLAFTTN